MPENDLDRIARNAPPEFSGRQLQLMHLDPSADGRQREPLPLETSLPGVFAVGDGRSGSIKRGASAVGEGAMAVRLIHEHLALMRGTASPGPAIGSAAKAELLGR